MTLSRRRLLVASVGAAVVVPAVGLAQRLLSGLPLVAPHVRPGPDGTTGTRCAQCGADDHAMLDARCPSAPRVI